MKFSLITREALQHYVVLAGFQPIEYLLPATHIQAPNPDGSLLDRI